MEYNSLRGRLESGELDERILLVCGKRAADSGRERIARILERHERIFNTPAEFLFSAPGRTELGGNHTDHQHGHVLAAAVDLDILASVSKNGDGLVRLVSEGYPAMEISLSDLAPRAMERNTSAALVRGIAARMSACAHELVGFDACLVSNVPGGSGLSSSAAFEVLIGTVFNELCAHGAYGAVDIAKTGQYAENVYFGKPCGLMDQTASAIGGAVFIDFKCPEEPEVERLNVELEKEGYALCIIDSGADHADLTGEYAAITDELKKVCAHFGKSVLREVDERDFIAEIPRLRAEAGDRAVLRGLHFYAEDRRAAGEADAIRKGDFQGFLDLVRESGRSSAMYLQNVIPTGGTREQALMLTIALADKLLAERGAVRVHGGGFGGTAQAFVPLDMADEFKRELELVLGRDCCRVVNIRAAGGVRLA